MKKKEDFVEDCYEIDEEYEFDASQFFDFTKPELDSQIEEAERWFQISGEDPHSPFVVKLDLDQILPPESAASSPKSLKSIKSTSSTTSDIDSRHECPPPKKNAKVSYSGKGDASPREVSSKPKIKQPHKLSKFMEPTASHLAKQNTGNDKQQLSSPCTRLTRARVKMEGTNSCPTELDAKCETGSVNKIMRTRTLPRRTKSKAHVTEFQEFHFKTSERANHHSSVKRNIMPTGGTPIGSPLVEELNKLSLASKSKRTSQWDSTSSKSSRGSFRSEFWR